jgi:hypothetical protein
MSISGAVTIPTINSRMIFPPRAGQGKMLQRTILSVDKTIFSRRIKAYNLSCNISHRNNHWHFEKEENDDGGQANYKTGA